MKYQWQAMDDSGTTHHGTLDAASSKEAREALRAQGLHPLVLNEKKVISLFRTIKKTPRLRLSGSELALIDGTIDIMLNHRLEAFAAATLRTITDAVSRSHSEVISLPQPFDIITKENM